MTCEASIGITQDFNHAIGKRTIVDALRRLVAVKQSARTNKSKQFGFALSRLPIYVWTAFVSVGRAPTASSVCCGGYLRDVDGYASAPVSPTVELMSAHRI